MTPIQFCLGGSQKNIYELRPSPKIAPKIKRKASVLEHQHRFVGLHQPTKIGVFCC